MKKHASEELTCWDVTNRASEYLEGCLPNLTKVLVSLHLGSCDRCRTYIKQIDLVSSTLRSLPKFYPSPVNLLSLRHQFACHHGQSAAGN